MQRESGSNARIAGPPVAVRQLSEKTSQESIDSRRYQQAMSIEPQEPDPAAVCACVLSLWQECKKAVKSDRRLNLSECYNGMDEFMRVLMRVATRFEAWACQHIVWGQLDDVWPSVLEDRFG